MTFVFTYIVNGVNQFKMIAFQPNSEIFLVDCSKVLLDLLAHFGITTFIENQPIALMRELRILSLRQLKINFLANSLPSKLSIGGLISKLSGKTYLLMHS